MSNPFAGVSFNSPQVVQPNNNGSPLDKILPVILAALQASQARKQRQAENTTEAIAPGTTADALTPDQQKAVKRARGHKLAPGEMVNPLPGQEGELERILTRIAPLGSSLRASFDIARAKQISTGAASSLTTPTGLAADVAGGEATSVASRDVAQAKGKVAARYKSATERQMAGETDFSPADLTALQTFNSFVPSQPVADQLSGQGRSEIMKQALRVARDPDSSSWVKLMPEGVKPSDVIGGVALGVGSMMLEGFQQQGQANLAKATRASEAEKALFGVAEDVSKKMGGKYDPTFIAAVMQGNPQALNTPAGRMISRFMDAGFFAGLQEAAVKGDPGAAAMKSLLEVAHIPQLAGNESLLANYSNLFRELTAATFTRSALGYDRPKEKGDQQIIWDNYNRAIAKQMGGLFQPHFFGSMTIDNTQNAGVPKPQEEKANDQDIAKQALDALYGPLGDLTVRQQKPRVLGRYKEITGAK